MFAQAYEMTHGRPIIGITGGIGSGKSTVARLFAALGCVVANADDDARAALRDPDIRDTIVEWWGTDVLDGDGHIDRAQVARIVFRDDEQRQRLEALTHPWVHARRDAVFRAAPAETVAYVIDAPLLMEVGLDRECDATVFVDSNLATRLERLATSRGWDSTELRRREDCQLPLDEKRRRADYVVRNDGDLQVLETHVRTVLNEIVKTDRQARRK